MKKIISKSIRKHVKTNDKDNRMVWNKEDIPHGQIRPAFEPT